MREQIESWKIQLGVKTNTELAALLGISATAVNNWMYLKSKPSNGTKKLIDLLLSQKKGGK